MKRIVILLLLSTSLYSGMAQVIETFSLSDIISVAHDKPELGKVKVIQDTRLTYLLNKHIVINAKSDGMPGWRIQIFFGTGNNARQNALNIETEFIELYPEIGTYLKYNAPYFKLYVGDFRTRREVYKFKKEINNEFPNAWIVQDLINFPKLEENE